MNGPFYICSCYFTHNIYVKTLNRHFTFINEDQFFKDYGKVLDAVGYGSADIASLIQEIITEINRRKLVHEKSPVRKDFIRSNYVPFDTSIYTLKEEFFEPSFIRLINASKSLNPEEVFLIIEQLSIQKKVYSFPIFKIDFCNKLLKELHHFEESNFPKEKPNTMNNYGTLIDDLGFQNFFIPLRIKYLDPLAKVIYPEWRGKGLDSHKIFTVKYKTGQDTKLDYHFDNSEVTLNICLGKKFEGSELYFGDMKTTPIFESSCILVPHKVGYGILHRGQQYHGALPIKSGERENLIIWMRSSSIRNSMCPMCQSKPSLIKSTDYGDGFTSPPETDVCDLM